jgi:hypothetical protein
MSEKLMSQVRFLCRSIREDEWSGILFYTSTGEFGTESFSVVAEELYLMDIGSSTYTEYDWGDPELIKFMMANPPVRKMQKGHIHSHNKMDVFFSGTDIDELAENAENHNYYLSVIVNNEGDICAKIAFHAKMRLTRTCTFSDGNGKEIIRTFTDKEETESIFAYSCKITTPDTLEDGFRDRFLDLKKEKEKPKVYTSLPKIDHSQRNTYGPGQAGEWDESFGIGVGVDQGLFEDVHGDANSKYSTSGIVGDENPWNKNKGSKEKSNQNASVGKTDSKPGFLSSAREKAGESADIITLASRIVALDPRYTGLLGPLMKRVHKGFWKDPIPDRALKVEAYFESIAENIVDLYKGVFSRDTNMVNFIARMGNVKDSISLYTDEHPELVAGMRNIIENIIKSARDAKQSNK